MRRIGKLAFASASLLALTVPAYAQDVVSGEEGLSEGEDIVVTARRRDESAQDVPLVVNAVTAEQMGRLNIRQFDEISKVVPGLSLQQNANGIGSTTTVRGVKFDVNASGNNGTVEYYLNDAPISAAFVLQSVFDVGQVELLRGPQGTLRGRASPSGSITVTTKKPNLNEIGGYVSGTGTTENAINAQAAVNVPIVPGVFAVRVAGIVDNNDGNQVRSIYGGPNPYNRTRGIRASARLDPMDGLSVNFTYQRMQQRLRSYDQVESVRLTNTEAGIQPGASISQPLGTIPGNPFAGDTLIRGQDRLSASNTPRNITQDFEIFTGSIDWRIGGQRLVYVANAASQHLVSQQHGDPGDLFGPSYGAALQNYGQFTDTWARQQSHELRLQSDDRLFGMVDYVIGGLINRLEAPSNLTMPTPTFCLGGSPTVPCATPGVEYPAGIGYLGQATTTVSKRTRTLERSVFGNVTLHLGERTELSGGIRYIHFNNQDTLYLFAPPANPGAGNLNALDQGITPTLARRNPTSGDYSAVIYTASAKHRFSENLMAYATVGSSWRPAATATGDFSICILALPTVVPGFPSCADQDSFGMTSPERSTSYEVGFKSNWFDRRLTLNASVFHQRFKNFVYRAPGNGAPYLDLGSLGPSVKTFNFIAGVPATVTGVEAEIAFRVNDNFDIGTSFTYALGKINNGRIPCADANGDGIPDASEALPGAGTFIGAGSTIASCIVNQRANDAPVFSGNIQAEYRQPLGNWGQGFLRGLFTYNGNSQGDPLNRFDQVDGYGLLDLFLGVRDPDGGWEIQAFAKNLTNTYRTLSRTSPLTTSVAFTNGQSANVFTNYRSVSSTAPREFGLSVRYAFGSR